jgi:hypothetical protein
LSPLLPRPDLDGPFLIDANILRKHFECAIFSGEFLKAQQTLFVGVDNVRNGKIFEITEPDGYFFDENVSY